MDIENRVIEGRSCYVIMEDLPEYLLIQPVDEHDLEGLAREAEAIREKADVPFMLAALRVEDWFTELSPWDSPAVYGKEAFGHGAAETLDWILQKLLPAILPYGWEPSEVPMVLGGYSLAGLFALWAACQTEAFKAVAAASPSVWFPGWIDYARSHKPGADHIYLSLGDREERAKNPVMASVGRCIRKEYEIAKAALGEEHCALEWNAGNHFKDAELRTASAFAWCLNRMKLR